MSTPQDHDALLQKNLAFLKRRISNFSYAAIESAKAKPGIMVRCDQDGAEPVFEAETRGGPVFLHSRRDPRGEAERQIKTWLEQEKPDLRGMIVLAGAAGLYHAEALLPLMSASSTLLVLESRPENLREVLRHRDISAMHAAGVNFVFAAQTDISLLIREYRHYISVMERFSVAVFVPPGLRRAFPLESARLLDAILKESSVEGLDRNTRANTSDEWIQHGVYNLPQLLHSPRIDCLKGRWDGCDAIVIGAGPSLNDSLPWLRKVAEHCLVFAVGTALRPLLAGGLEPDFVVSIDSDIIIMNQFKGIEKGNYFLLAPYSIFPSLAQSFEGRSFYFSNTALKSFNAWLKSFGALPAPAAAGGTVAVSAIDLARYLGCKRIILAGLDLAMLGDGTSHAAKSIYEGERQKLPELVSVPGNYEEKVFTTPQFAMYIDILNMYLDDAVREGTLFHNATNGGAAFRNVSLMRPEELASFPWTEVLPGKGAYIRKLYDEAPRCDKEAACRAMRESVAALRRLQEDAAAAAQVCEILGSDPEKLRNGRRLLDELSKIEARIKETRTANLLVTGALEALFMDLYANAPKPDAGGEPSTELMQHSLKFYQHLKGGADWMGGMLEIALKGYESNFRFMIGQ